MKLLVCGSRTILLRWHVFEALDEYHLTENDLIICGGAKGVDKNAMRYAAFYEIPLLVIDPDYEKHGSRAPLLRDAEMAKMCDKAVAIWDGKSHGTDFTVRECIKNGKEVKVIHVNV